VQKAKLSNIELVFVLIAASILFVITVQQLSTSGVLPGNDPAVHLARAKIIVMNERVSYSEIAWYPPFFHIIIAMTQILSGTLDVMASAFIIKLIIASFNVLLLLATYLLSRKIFGIGVAVVSAVFTVLSVPLIEMVFWGGYANFMGLAYIAFVFYIMSKDLGILVKTGLLFVGTFTLGLSHQLTAFVFVLMFVPVFLFSAIDSKKRFIAFFAVVVGGGLAFLAWYAQILIDYGDIIIEEIFFKMAENVNLIPAVSLNSLLKNLGATLLLACAGIPLMIYILKKRKALKDSILILFWFIVPFLLAESYLFGIHLPYNRFIYFFASPLTILSAVTIYYTVKKSGELLEAKVFPKIAKKLVIQNVIQGIVMGLIFSLLFFQTFLFVYRVEPYPEFYETGSISSYESGQWVKHHSVPDGTVVTSQSPGSWFYIFSDHQTIQETDPINTRNPIAESILYSFYEMENTNVSAREFDTVSPSAGFAMYASRYNILTKTFSIPNNLTAITYVDPMGEWITIPLNETVETIYWAQESANESKLVSEYNHELFTLNRTVTLTSNCSTINIEWNLEVHRYLALVKLDVINWFESSLDFKEALVPGLLAWQNPWDNPLLRHENNQWATLNENPATLDEKIIAVLDQTNGMMTAFEFDEHPPHWFVLGALPNRVLDALRLTFVFGDLEKNESRHVDYSALAYAHESDEKKRKTVQEVKELLEAETDLSVQTRDFQTYINEYNIKFVAIDTQQVLSNIEATPTLDKVYDSGRVTIYATKR